MSHLLGLSFDTIPAISKSYHGRRKRNMVRHPKGDAGWVLKYRSKTNSCLCMADTNLLSSASGIPVVVQMGSGWFNKVKPFPAVD
jgi:hypothetical protein